MRRYGSIYKIKNNVTGLEYVGQTTQDVSKRYISHCKETRNRHISNSIRLYGKEYFEVTELCIAFDKETLNNLEIYFVEKFNTLHPNGYNHRAGGNQNGLCSNETKRKISQSKTGKALLQRRGEVRSQEQRLLISRTLGGESVVGINLKTNEIKIYNTVTETRKDGHNPSNIVQICKNTGRRKISKGWTFFYQSEYVNQSGSLDLKNLDTRNA